MTGHTKPAASEDLTDDEIRQRLAMADAVESLYVTKGFNAFDNAEAVVEHLVHLIERQP